MGQDSDNRLLVYCNLSFIYGTTHIDRTVRAADPENTEERREMTTTRGTFSASTMHTIPTNHQNVLLVALL
jgi:hypothetical protein